MTLILARRQLLPAFLIALFMAIGGAAISVIARADCGILGCFEPGVQGEIWQSLTPWGSIQQRTPGVDTGYPGPNGALTASATEDYATELANLAEGECTFSHDADGLDIPRQCKVGGNIVPPPLGKMMYPYALAVDGPRVYVADQYNHRLQVFDFDGNPIEIERPMGNGVPGIGEYPVTQGKQGQRLRAPEGIAVDASRNVLVADSYNSRVAIFKPTGAVAFGTEAAPINKSVVDGVAGEPSIPTGIAITPGATALQPGTAVASNDEGRIVVSDRDQCFVYFYDLGFNLKRQIPDSLPPGHAQGACVYPDGENAVPVGVFGSVTGVAIDQSNRVYVTDYDNSRVTIFNHEGDILGTFGQPPVLEDGEIPPPESLQAPWGIMVDHLNRVVITDSDNQRISFYSVAFDEDGVAPHDPPVATYLFQLNAGGTLNGFPTGIAEQLDADPKGRILTTDTQHHRIQRFQLPDLAIVKPAAAGGAGSFEVVVPVEKADDVNGVTATVEPVVPGTASNIVVTALAPAQPTSNDIGQGQTVRYQFTYTSSSPIVTFKINASGNGGNTEALEVEVTATAPCTNCGATHVVYNATGVGVTPATPITVGSASWYNQQLVVRVTPTGTEEVTHIGWFVTGQAVADHGGWIHKTPVSVGSTFADVSFNRAGTSVLTYWAITSDGATSSRTTVPLSIDLAPPLVDFIDWTPITGTDPNGDQWNNTAVTANFTITDEHSGSATPSGSVSFPSEGRDQSQPITVVDNVGHSASTTSSAGSVNGRSVNIDTTAPTFNVPAPLTITANTPNGAVIPVGTFDATNVVDPALVVAGPAQAGSGVASVTNPGTFEFPVGTSEWEFIATDYAGNQRKQKVAVTVQPATTTIFSPPATVQYGQTLAVSANVSPSFATGSVTFTLGARTEVATLSGGLATASFTVVKQNVGTHTMGVAYSGTPGVPATSTTAQITVTPAPITVTAASKTKVYGTADPALTWSITAGALVSGDAFTGDIARNAGENVATSPYTIHKGTLALSANYDLTFITGTLTITPRPLTITADPKAKPVGGAEPPLTYQITSGTKLSTDSFSGGLTRVPGETPGTYAILIGSLTLGPNYALSYVGANFDISSVAVHVQANEMSKIYGNNDPTFTYSYTGNVTPEMFTGSLERTEHGENVGHYRIEQGSLALPPGYVIFYHGNYLNITKRPATVRAHNEVKVYGQPNPGFSATVTGTVDGDTLTYSLASVANDLSNVGGYPITVTVDEHPNYLVNPEHGELVISKKPATVTAGSGSKVYGEPNVTIGVTSSGFLSTDTMALSAARAEGENAGDYTTTAQASGPAINNYQVTYVNGLFTITRRPATIAAGGGTKVYGTAGDPALSATSSGFLPGDNITVTTTRVPGENAGDYTTTATANGVLASNYEITSTTGTFVIERKPATVTAANASKTYGDPNPAFEATTTGTVGTDSLVFDLTSPATTVSPVGNYPIAVTLGANPNYIVTKTDGQLDVTRRDIRVTATPDSKVYGSTDPALLYTFTGGPLVAGDGFNGAIARNAGENVGSYAITQGTLALSGNYTLTFVGANLSISQRPATVTANDNGKIEGASDPALTVSTAGFFASDNITFTATRAGGEAVGTYVITPRAEGALLGNYAVEYRTGTFTIRSANLAPICSAARGGEIWPPNHKKFYAAPITGVVDPEGQPVTILVTGIFQDELLDSTGDGKFSPDGQGVGTSTAWVRAERNGKGNKAPGDGRVYEILFTATDAGGAQCTGSVMWTVPHDQGQRSEAIDSGVRYDSTGVIPGARDKWQIHQKSPQP